MQIVQALTNGPYPNRIQLVVNSPYFGPFMQIGPLGAFNPARDLSIYVDGSLQTVQSWAFDGTNNRYLIYLVQAIDPQGFVQVVHHVPNPPFVAFLSGSPVSALFVPGFALVATYIPTGDVVSPFMSLVADPNIVNDIAGSPVPNSVFLLWLTEGVPQVVITDTNGLNTMLLGPSGVYILDIVFGPGWGQQWGVSWGSGLALGTITLTMNGYPATATNADLGLPIAGLAPVTATITVV